MKRIFIIVLLLPVLVYSQTKRPITIEDLWSMGRISSTTLSPNGRYVAFTLTYYDMEENKGNADIWLVDVLTKELTQITNSKDNETSPCWFPDSKRLAYLAPKDGATQIFYVEIKKQFEPVQITKISTDVNGFTISKDGNKILFVSDVYPDCQTDECNKERNEAKEKSKVKARIYNELMFRHWNEWRDERRSHLFSFDLLTNKYVDIMQGSKSDCPPIALGGKLDYTFSPEGNEICYVINTDPMVAISTNNNLWISTLDGKAQRLITTNKGNDNQPIYSPDGKYLLYRSMARAGFEAERQNLMLYNRATGKTTNLTQSLDRSVDEVVWHPNSEDIYFTADNQGRKAIYHLNINSKKIENIYDKHWNTDLNISHDGNFLIFNQSAVTRPAEIFKFDINTKEVTQLTNINERILSKLELMPLEDFWCKGANGTMVHTLMVKPPNFDPNKKYPMIFLVHGGPQGAWEDLWHWRWNPSLYASRGYVVIMPNPRAVSYTHL
ncbi:MAG: S9 family peptidase, partial [Ignavibacteria bacterium]|nr:S9 family peptidase [Ignavibacteria bacterium]